MRKENGGWGIVDTNQYLEAFGIKVNKKVILNGNRACALGALVANCKFFAGYPITPSTEILHTMTKYLPQFGGVWYTPEDEISSIGMCIAWSLCGGKAMTATSGPGLSLMQEELGLAILNEVPLVIVNAMRVGPSTGQPTKSSSADINCMIHGRHGDAGDTVVILSPRSVSECFSMTISAFNITEKWRVPVFIAIDGYLSQLEEPITLPECVWTYDRIKDRGEPAFGTGGNVSNFIPIGGARAQSYTGVMHDSLGNRNSYSPDVAEEYISHLLKKHANIIPSLQNDPRSRLFEKETIDTDTELLLVSYGIASRASQDAATRLKELGIKIAHLNLPILWPLHASIFESYQHIPRVVIVENNTGQLLPFITPYFSKAKVSSFTKWNGTPIETRELVSFCETFLKKETVKREISTPNVCVAEDKEKTNDTVPWHEYTKIPFVFLHETESDAEKEKQTSDIIMQKHYPFCPGCGHESFINYALPMFIECGLTNNNTIFVSGIGCGSVVPTILNAHLIKTSHGRAINEARAVKLKYPEKNVVVISGDGDLINIGGNHLIHTARAKRLFPMVCFCLDNANYGMTGGQPSATTPQSAITSLSSDSSQPFDLKKLLFDGCEIDFFARVSVADHKYLSEVIRKAIAKAQSGTFAFVQVFSHCTAYFVKNNRGHFSTKSLAELQGIWERE